MVGSRDHLKSRVQVSTAVLSTTAKKAAKSKSSSATPMEVDPPAAADKKGLF